MPKNPAAVALGSLGGKSKSDAKKAAAQLNGKKGGRPKKVPVEKPQLAKQTCYCFLIETNLLQLGRRRCRTRRAINKT